MSVTFLGTWDTSSYLFSWSLHSSGEEDKKKKCKTSWPIRKYSTLEAITALGEKLRATGEELVSAGAGLAAGLLQQIRDLTGSCYHSVLNVIKQIPDLAWNGTLTSFGCASTSLMLWMEHPKQIWEHFNITVIYLGKWIWSGTVQDNKAGSDCRQKWS